MQTVVGHLQRMRGKLQNRRHGEAGNQSEFHKSSNSVRQPRYQSVCSDLSHSPSRARNHRASLSTSTRLIPYQPSSAHQSLRLQKWRTSTLVHRRARDRMVAPDTTIAARAMVRVKVAITVQRAAALRILAIMVHVLSRTRIPL
jgi:hypothetical protein